MDEQKIMAYQVWWANAGCLPDSETPAFEANSFAECEAWLSTDEALEFLESAGDYNTYSFQIEKTIEGAK